MCASARRSSTRARGFGPRSAFGFFLTPLSNAHGWGRDVFAFSAAVQTLISGAAQPFAGGIADRFGATRVIITCTLLYAVGLFDTTAIGAAAKRARGIRAKATENFEERGLRTLFLGLGMATWTNTRGTGVPAAPVNDVGQVADHEQTAALSLVQALPEPTVALPLSFEGERVLHRRPPPRLGEHTSEILGELGYAGDEIERMNAQGIVRRVKSNA